MNSILKSAAKIIEELIQPIVKSDGTQHKRGKIERGCKKNGKTR